MRILAYILHSSSEARLLPIHTHLVTCIFYFPSFYSPSRPFPPSFSFHFRDTNNTTTVADGMDPGPHDDELPVEIDGLNILSSVEQMHQLCNQGWETWARFLEQAKSLSRTLRMSYVGTCWKAGIPSLSEAENTRDTICQGILGSCDTLSALLATEHHEIWVIQTRTSRLNNDKQNWLRLRRQASRSLTSRDRRT